MPKGIRQMNRGHRMADQPGILFNSDSGDNGAGGSGGSPAASVSGDAGSSSAGDGGDQLGDAGKKALDSEREARRKSDAAARDEKKRADDLQRQIDELRAGSETADQKSQREADKALQKARDEAAAEARAEVTRDRVFDKIEVAATGRFTDPTDARLHLEKRVDEFIKDGQPDVDAISKAVEQLLTDKPHLAATTKAPVPSPGRAGIGTGSTSASDAVTPGLGRLQHAYAQSPHNK